MNTNTNTNTTNQEISLKYFNLNARGAMTRAILHFSKIPFKDIQLTDDDFAKIQKDLLYEFVPQLEINNNIYCQTHAINIYLAQKYNLYGNNIDEEYKINEILFSFEDVAQHYFTYLFPEEFGRDDKNYNRDLCYNKSIEATKKVFSQYEKNYIKNGKGKYYLNNKDFSLADIYICFIMWYFPLSKDYKDTVGKLMIESCPSLYECMRNIKDNELKSFYENIYLKDTW